MCYAHWALVLESARLVDHCGVCLPGWLASWLAVGVLHVHCAAAFLLLFSSDFGYVWNADKTECVLDKTVPANISRGMLCSTGQKFYNASKG